MESAADSSGFTRIPPGTAAPTATDRAARLRDPAHLERLNAGRAAFLALPKEERQRRAAEKKADRAAKEAEKAARYAAAHPAPAAPPQDDAPPTVRSSRGIATTAPPPADPIGVIGRPGSMQLRGLLDLCDAMPTLGDGVCFIQVNRLKPTTAYNVNCAGIQKPIYDPIDDAEFALAYGGAEYQLRGYTETDGRRKALTEPVVYRVAGPPNLESALTEDDLPMRPQPAPAQTNGRIPHRPGLVTPHAATAEAEMYGRRLSHEETMDQRNAEREERQRQRREQSEQEREGRHLDAAKLIADRSEREIERAREDHERQLERERATQNKGSSMEDMAKLLEVLKPGEDTQALTRQHANEIKQISQSHKEELMRLTEQQRTELMRISDAQAATLHRLEEQSRLERERADGLIRESERRAGEQIREAERRADGRVTDFQNQSRSQYDDLKTRSEERVRDQNDQWQRRFDDLKAAHEREIRQKDSEILLMRTNLEGNMTVILAGKDTEIKRLQHDIREARDTAEKNKDWVSKMKEAGETAEALGYVKPEPGEGGEGEDLKTTAVKAGLGMLTQLPQIIASASEAVGKMRNPGVPPELARAQARAGMTRGSQRTVTRMLGQAPLELQPLSFATEDGGYVPPGGAEPPRASAMPYPYPEAQQQPLPALEQSSTQPVLQMPQQQTYAPPPQQPAPQQAPVAYAAPPQPQQPSAHPPAPELTQEQLQAQFQRAPQPSVPPPASVAPAPSLSDAEIEMFVTGAVAQFAPTLAMNFAERVPPATVAQSFIATNGVEHARNVLGFVTIEQVLRHITADPNYFSTLGTRNGQKFLREIWKSALQQVGG